MIIVTCGISGSGKSTWIKEFLHDHRDEAWAVICPDSIRKEFTGNVSDQSKNKEVWEEAYSRLKRFICADKDILFDSTCTNLATAKTLCNIAFEYHTEIRFKILYCLKSEAYNRILKNIQNNVDRSNVPKDVIERQYQGFLTVVKWLKDNDKFIIN